MSNRDAFNYRKQMASEFVNGSLTADIVRKYGVDHNTMKNMIIFEIGYKEYNRIAHIHKYGHNSTPLKRTGIGTGRTMYMIKKTSGTRVIS